MKNSFPVGNVSSSWLHGWMDGRNPMTAQNLAGPVTQVESGAPGPQSSSSQEGGLEHVIVNTGGYIYLCEGSVFH